MNKVLIVLVSLSLLHAVIGCIETARRGLSYPQYRPIEWGGRVAMIVVDFTITGVTVYICKRFMVWAK